MTTIMNAAPPAFLTQIFYKNKTFDETFRILQSTYAFTPKFKEQALSNIPKSIAVPQTPIVKQGASERDLTINPYTKCGPPEIPTSPAPPSTTSPTSPAPPPITTLYDTSPRVADSLFWSIYVAVYGKDEFERIRSNYALAEMKEKSKIAAFFSTTENRQKLKETKYKVSKGGVQEIQSDCHTQSSTTGFLVVCAMSVFYNKNIWIVDRKHRVFLRFDGNPKGGGGDSGSPVANKIPCMILYKTHDSRNRIVYTVETCPTGNIADAIQTEYICLDHYDTPIKAPSNYKMEDLEDMAVRLGIDLSTKNKWKKSDLYEAVKQTCIWRHK
jgi:hypothetical protein